MGSSDSASSSSLSYRPALISYPDCDHEFPTHILTDHTDGNPGRRYFACSIRKAGKDKHEAELRCKDVIHQILQEKLNMKTQESELLKVMLQKANTEIECQKRNVWAMVQGFVLVVVAVAFVFRFVRRKILVRSWELED